MVFRHGAGRHGVGLHGAGCHGAEMTTEVISRLSMNTNGSFSYFLTESVFLSDETWRARSDSADWMFVDSLIIG